MPDKKYVDGDSTKHHTNWDSEAKYNDELYDEYNDYNRQKWVEQVTKDKDFYLGKQWTKPEKDELEERGQSAWWPASTQAYAAWT